LNQSIKNLELPKACLGLDKKDWALISNMIKFTFQNTDITIRIYKLELENKMEDNSLETIAETSVIAQINIIGN